ncbi:MAG: CatB-related O-acetyltransferase [Neisseriaceae bacterium]|nr:CatB-related O-acetyltransferase [Neisseriaceae bacterium]
MLYKFVYRPDYRDIFVSEFLHLWNVADNSEVRFSDKTAFYSTVIKGNSVFRGGAYSFCMTPNMDPMFFNMGNYCSLSWGLKILFENHPYERFSTSVLTYKPRDVLRTPDFQMQAQIHSCRFSEVTKTFRIANDVWIGQDVILANKIVIHTGACVAGGAVVVKDVPPYAIVGGNPAKIIKYRFEDNIIEKLLETRWTEYDIAPMKIRGDIPVEQFIDVFYDYKDKGKIKPIVLKNLKEILDKHGIEYTQV